MTIIKRTKIFYSHDFYDLAHEEKRCGDEQRENDNPDRAMSEGMR